MTSQERADKVIKDWWKDDDTALHDLVYAVTKAIDDAVAEERDRITKRIIDDIRERGQR